MPPPSTPTIIGSTTVRANRAATAASTALPPPRSISAPAAAASGWLVTTIARDPTAGRFSQAKVVERFRERVSTHSGNAPFVMFPMFLTHIHAHAVEQMAGNAPFIMLPMFPSGRRREWPCHVSSVPSRARTPAGRIFCTLSRPDTPEDRN